MGLVCTVTADAKDPRKPTNMFRHPSSRQCKVAGSDYSTCFKGSGVFCR